MQVSYVPGANLLTRFNGFPAAKVTGSQASGYSYRPGDPTMESVASESCRQATACWAGPGL